MIMEIPRTSGSAHGERRRATPGYDVPPFHLQGFYDLLRICLYVEHALASDMIWE